MTTVCGNDEPRVDALCRTVAAGNEETIDRAAARRGALHEDLLFHGSARIRRSQQQCHIEIFSQDRTSADTGGIPAVDAHTIRSGDQHAVDGEAPRGVCDTQALEKRERAGIDGVAAQLVPWKARAIE